MLDAHILIVDDEEAILQMVEMIMKKEGFTKISQAVNGEEALNIVRSSEVDFIVLDVMLPDVNGFDLCKKIREYTNVHVLFLTARTNDIDILTGFENGGDDYVTKPFNPLEIAARVKAHLKRREYKQQPKAEITNSQYRFKYFTVDEAAGELIVNGEVVTCPAQVFMLLIYFCKNVNQVLSKEQLFNAVWGYDDIVDDNTIMVHIRRLREKIEPDPGKPVYLQTVRGLGYKLVRREQL